ADPTGWPRETRLDQVRRACLCAHLTTLRTGAAAPASRGPGRTSHSPYPRENGVGPEIPSRRVAKRKPTRIRNHCVIACSHSVNVHTTPARYPLSSHELGVRRLDDLVDENQSLIERDERTLHRVDREPLKI